MVVLLQVPSRRSDLTRCEFGTQPKHETLNKLEISLLARYHRRKNLHGPKHLHRNPRRHVIQASGGFCAPKTLYQNPATTHFKLYYIPCQTEPCSSWKPPTLNSENTPLFCLAGETYLVPNTSFSSLITHISAELPAAAVQLNWPVEGVRYSEAGAELTGPGGRLLRCRRLLITVPLTVLRAERIRFQPPLPPAKKNAIGRLKMSNAIKVRIKG